MAKLLFGVGIADARNSLGGHVFSKNQFGAYVRQKVSPAQPRTNAQLNVRSTFGQFSKAWGSILSDAQRAGWLALAASNPRTDKFGNPQVLTGLQMYQAVNRNLFTIGHARLDTAPGGQSVQGLASLTLTVTVTGTVFSVVFTPTPLNATSHLVVFATPPVSPGKRFITPLLKQLFADTTGTTTSPQALWTQYLALFGTPPAGQAITINAFIVDDTTGAASTPFTASAIVGP